jgi:hypothetical protein
MGRSGLLIILIAMTAAVYADVIYDAQTFDWSATWNGFSIYAGNGYETADDFETAEDWTLETISFWELWSSQHNIRVHIFSDSAGAPGSVLYQEEVTAWWSNCYFYDGGWFDSYDYFGEASACEFELHGSPPDAAVEPVSLGTIKAGFAE